MKIFTIEQIENGGTIEIIEKISDKEHKQIYYSTYPNVLNILNDLNKSVFNDGNIYSKQIDNNKIILIKDDGTIINLVNFKLNILINTVEKKLYSSFNKFFNNINNQNYQSIHLNGKTNGLNFIYKDNTILIELEVNQNGELTKLSEQILNEFLSKELRNWNKIFVYGEENGLLKVCYDNKILLVGSNLIKYVKPKVENMYQIYLQSLENYNKKRGI